MYRLFLLLALLFIPFSAQAQIFVDAGNTASTKDGTTWAKAYASLATAITNASAGDSIFVKGGGLFKPTTGTSRGTSFALNKVIGVFGGFAGTETGSKAEILAARPKNFVQDTLSGDIGTVGSNSDNSYHVVNISVAGVTLDGFAITKGEATGGNYDGAGVYMNANSTLRNLEIYDNESSGGVGSEGGGVWMNKGTLTHSIIRDNGSGEGGGVYVSGSAKVLNCAIYKNRATSGLQGGGLSVNGSALLVNNTIYGNVGQLGALGGGMYIATGSAKLYNNIFYSNTGAGRGIYSLNAQGSTFSNNLAEGANASGAISGQVFSSTPNCIFTTTDPFASTTGGDRFFLRLKGGSQALDAGLNAQATWALDLAGVARTTDDDATSGAVVDMGAYEGAVLYAIYVDAGNTSGAKDGTTWAKAYSQLTTALATAVVGDTILVKGGGTFKPTTGSSATATFALNKAIVIYGGFVGTETGTTVEAIVAQRPANFVRPILSGDIGTAGYVSDNSYRVVSVTTAGVVLDGFAVTGGNARTSTYRVGAGVYMTANGTLRNLDVYRNRTSSATGAVGGGLYMTAGTITHSRIHHNDSDKGGGVFVNGSANVLNCAIYSNRAFSNGAGLSLGGKPVVASNTIHGNGRWNNSTSLRGGGVYIAQDAKLYNNMIYGNTSGSSSNGDDVYCLDRKAVFQYNLIKGSTVAGAILGTDPTNLTGSVATSTNPYAGTTEGSVYFLRLGLGSPAIDAGLNSQATWALDLAGAARIHNSTVDIGAYEVGGDRVVPVYVDAGNTSATTKDGTSWANAYDSLNLAIAGAKAGDTLLVKGGGTFKPTRYTNRTKSFTINKKVVIYGGLSGTEVGATIKDIVSQRSATFTKPILSGDIGTADTESDNSHHVVKVTAAGAVLDGFAITGGHGGARGAGVNVSANATLRNLEVYSNKATVEGGGVYLSAGVVSHSTIRNNGETSGTDAISGGGVGMSGGTLTHSVIHNNRDGEGSGGSGVYATGGNVLNNLIYSNTASAGGGGGAVSLKGGARVVNNTIYGNTYKGLRLAAASAQVYNNIIYGNSNSEVDNSKSGVTFQYNLVEGASVAGAIYGTAPSDLTGNVATNTSPFVSTTSTNANYLRLTSTAPAIDKANGSYLPADVVLDLAGNARIQGLYLDMGAYESAYEGVFSVRYVDASSTYSTDTDIGTTWAKAYDSLGDAISAASQGDTLFVKGGGTFKPTAGTSRDKIFTINKAVLIYGGFLGTETGTAAEILSARPKNFVKPILSGDIGVAIGTLGDFTDAGYTDNSKGVVKVTADGAVLDGFVIVAGNNTGNGGGVNMTGNSTLRNLEIYGNIANDGGAIDLIHGTITHSILYDNKARSAGGGVAIKQRGRIINNVIRGNTADASWDSGGGGGLYVPGHNISTYKIEVLSNTVYNNTASGGHGGGITFDHYHSNVIVAANNIFYDNKAPAAGKKAEINVFGANHNVTFSHNLVKGANATANIWGTFASGTPNCVFTTTSPFVSTTEADAGFLHLSSASSARNVGLNSRVSWALDLAGLERIEGGTVDMGAYEAPMAAITGIALNATSVAHLTAANVKVADISVKTVGLYGSPTITYSLKNANAATDTFKVVGSELKTNKEIDYAKLNDAHSAITIVASHTPTGEDAITYEEALTITITPPTLTGITLSHATIGSNLGTDALVGSLTAAGTHLPSNGTGIVFTIAEGNDAGYFKISGNSLQVAKALQAGTYNLKFTATYAGISYTNTAAISVTVSAVDITGISLSPTSVAHLTAANVRVGGLSSTHTGLGANPTITYSLKNANATTDTFKVVGSDLKTNKAIDYDKLHSSHSAITIVASHTPQSGSAVTYEKSFAVTITPPTISGIVLDGNTSSPGGSAGDRIGTLTATGSHLPTNGYTGITFTLESENGNATATYFQIGSGNELQAKTALVAGNYSLVFKASYIGVEYTHSAIQVSVTAAASITDITLNSSSIGHLTAANVKVADLSASHANLGDNPTITYSIKNADTSTDTFKIEGSELKTNKAIDYSILGSSHSPITIVASHTPTGEDAITYEEPFTIAITAPTLTGISFSGSSSLGTNWAVDDRIGRLKASGTHLPANGSGIVFTIAEGDDAGYFKIVNDSILKVAKTLQAGVYDLKFMASYLGISYTSTTSIRFTVLSVGITAIRLSSSAVAHLTAADVKVADLSVTTTGLGVNPTITYSLKDADAANDTFKVVGAELKTNKAIDYSILGSSHSSITLVASHTPTNGDAVSHEEVFTITITPPAITGIVLDGNASNPGGSAGDRIGTLTAAGNHLPTDGHTGITFTLESENDGAATYFQVGSGNELQVKTPLVAGNYNLVFKASYIGVEYTHSAIQVQVTTDESITDILLSSSDVSHLTAADVKVADLSASHANLGDNPTITYSIKNADTSTDTFKIVGSELRTNKLIDYSLLGSSHSPITIVASHTPQNGSAVTYEEAFTITITPPEIESIAFLDDTRSADIIDGAAPNTEIGALKSLGSLLPIGGSGIGYSVVTGGDIFKVEDGVLRVKNPPSIGASPYSVVLEASYLGVRGRSTFTLRVTEVSISLTLAPASPSVAHLTPVDSEIATLSGSVSGLGDNPTLIYTLVDYDASTDTFKVEGNKLRTNKLIDYGVVGLAHDAITLRVSSPLTALRGELRVSVGVDPPTLTGVSPTALGVRSDASVDAIVGSLRATGTHLPVDGSSVTFSITGGNEARVFKVDGSFLKTAKEIPSGTDNYTLQVEASYLGITQATATDITINVGADYSITGVSLTNNTSSADVIDGAVVGTLVGVLESEGTGLPSDGSGIEYSITSGNDDPEAFEIVGNNLRVKNPPDRSSKNSYTLGIEAAYAGTTGSGELTLSVTDVSITLTLAPESPSVAHLTPVDSEVGTLTASVSGLGDNPTLTYTLVDYDASTDTFKVVVNKLLTNKSIDYGIVGLAHDAITLRVSSPLTTVKGDLTVSVGVSPPTLTGVSPTTLGIQSGSAPDVVLGLLSVSGTHLPMGGSGIALSITGGNEASVFKLDGDLLKTASPVPSDTDSYTLQVEASYLGITHTTDIAISVGDYSITGVSFADGANEKSLLSGSSVGTIVGSLRAEGNGLPADGLGVVYRISSGNLSPETFEIAENALRVKRIPVISEKADYELEIKALYAGIEGSGTVRVLVIGPAITAITTDPTSLSVAHGTAANTDVATLSVTQRGLGDTPVIAFSIKDFNASSSPFKVDANKLKTNLAIDKGRLGASHKLTLVATHTPTGGSPVTKEQEVTIAITGTVPPALATLGDLDTYVYPNPTTGLLHLRSSAKVKRLRLLDASGSVVLRAKRANALNISALPAGTYLLELVTAEGNLRLPVLKR